MQLQFSKRGGIYPKLPYNTSTASRASGRVYFKSISMQQGTGCGGPTEGLGSPTGGLNDSTEDTFLRNRTQFCIKKSPTGIKLFPIGGGLMFPEGRTLPPLAPPLDIS